MKVIALGYRSALSFTENTTDRFTLPIRPRPAILIVESDERFRLRDDLGWNSMFNRGHGFVHIPTPDTNWWSVSMVCRCAPSYKSDPHVASFPVPSVTLLKPLAPNIFAGAKQLRQLRPRRRGSRGALPLLFASNGALQRGHGTRAGISCPSGRWIIHNRGVIGRHQA
jgi:hypothetical protein